MYCCRRLRCFGSWKAGDNSAGIEVANASPELTCCNALFTSPRRCLRLQAARALTSLDTERSRRSVMSIPSYISVPSSASPIPQPSGPSSSNHAAASTQTSIPLQRMPSFPPSSSSSQGQNQNQQPRKFTVPSTSSITSNVSDMLLSSLLPSNLPRLPGGSRGSGPGVPRELSTRREALSLPLVSNNFRRFVTKVSETFVDAFPTRPCEDPWLALRRGHHVACLACISIGPRF